MRSRTHWLAAALTVWLAGSAAAMAALEHYSATPGARTAAPARWPSDSSLPRTPGRASALVFAHPMCPCTRATFEELRKAMQKSDGSADITVVFIAPQTAGPEWSTFSMNGVSRVLDVGGDEARRFGALTSGEVVFYDENGKLMFSGGITPSRGHEGDNAGRSALEALLGGLRASGPETPVFGCALHEQMQPRANR